MPAAYGDLTALIARLNAGSGESIKKTAHKVIADAAVMVQKEAMALAPVKTGRLRGSITVKINKGQAVIGPSVPYGVFQEFGTGTRGEFKGAMYEIRPKNAAYLVFKTKDGKRVRTKLVRHPGIKGKPYMRPAVTHVLSDVAPDILQAGALLITKGPNAA